MCFRSDLVFCNLGVYLSILTLFICEVQLPYLTEVGVNKPMSFAQFEEHNTEDFTQLREPEREYHSAVIPRVGGEMW